MLAALVAALAQSAGAKPGFVVVAPYAWHGALKPLAHARSAEFAVELAALEDLVAGESGCDPPERLKRHLFHAWKERNARYALLAGDADTLPVRFMTLDRETAAAANYAFYASDLYYADVARADGTFDDWNAARDGYHARYFGEVHGEAHKDGPIDFDRVSYVPELALGRWPVSDVESLGAVVAKTLAWSPSSDPRALFVHSDGWVDERERASAMAARLQARGWSAELSFFGDAASAPEPQRTLDALTRGLDLAVHLGHGSSESWDGCFGPLERERSRAARPSICFSVGCNTAEFCVEAPYHAYVDEHGVQHRGTNGGEVFAEPPPPPHWLQPGPYNLTGLGERLLRMPSGGAVAYIGCNTGAQPCAVTLLAGFTGAIADGAPRLGDAWRAALAHYYEAEHLATLAPSESWYPPSVFFQGMKFMLFGDPTLELPRAK